MSASEAPSSPMPTWLGSLLTPGSALRPKMRRFMNALFVAVGVVAIGLFLGWGINIHTCAFMFLLVGTAISTNWFFTLLAETPLKEVAPATPTSGSEPGQKATPSSVETSTIKDDAVAADSKISPTKGARRRTARVD